MATARADARAEPGWRRPRLAPSLAEVYRTIPVGQPTWWRKALAFAGPGYLVAVGYMDPGNWATDLAGGSAFGYSLLSVILISNLMAILLQGLAAKLGVATGRDLAQACRDHYSRPTSIALWVLCEIAIAACDLAEVIGSAVALNRLFGIPLPWGIAITALDVLLVLLLQHKGFRLLEALVVTLIATIAGCFIFEILISRPGLVDIAAGFVPGPSILQDPGKLYIAIGILGATVMPHNLYLHSSIVQTRRYEETPEGKREAVKYAFLDSTIALTFALFINAAILIVAAATFHRAGHRDRAGGFHGDLLRRGGHGAAPHPEPGHPQPAALVRGVPAGAVHVGARQDGRVREPSLAQSARLWRRRANRPVQRLAPGADLHVSC